MKGRIRELAFEAGGKFRKFNKGAAMYQNVESDLQNFAELIVAECMEQVWYTREDSINGNISEVIKERIKQHFGVAE